MPNGVYLGIDVGSTTVKLVVLDDEKSILAHTYVRANGRPRQTVLEASEILAPFANRRIAAVGLTGSGGGPIAEIIGGDHVNELIAQTRSVGEYYPQARTIIEIGGQDSKFLAVEWDAKAEQMIMLDFAMNALCAAGTGSFLDQQAERLGISIDREFADLALQSSSPARVAGRCTVFAKSDMIHLQQKGTPLPDILMGLCLALARNFRSVIGKGKPFTPPILFQGGVAHNGAVARAFESVLSLQPGQLIVPRFHWIMAAIGTALNVMDESAAGRAAPFRGFEPLADSVRSGRNERRTLAVLREPAVPSGSPVCPPAANVRLPVFLGIDVGSISTKVALIDGENHVVARHYRMTSGAPLEAIRQALGAIGEEVGDRIEVRAVGATGSGRYLTGDFVGADVVRNEITSQARAAVSIDAHVDTIFEIGGQDSKYIRVDNGAVVDFAMNNACAAGTGSFLEEQSERLKISICDDFSRLAFASSCPAALGERCTVFMESDLVHHQQQGARVEDLTAGLAYSIAENYLNRVVSGRPVGRRVLFQGAVALNRSVVAALAARTQRAVAVPPHNDITGAIGVAILAREAMARRSETSASRFRGFDLTGRHYESELFECRACPNLCEVNRVVITGEPPIYYGARCDRFEEAGRNKDAPWRRIPDLFAERQALLLGTWTDPGPRPTAGAARPRVAMSRTLLYHELFPFWRTLFDELDMDVVLTQPTNPVTIRETQTRALAETCLPAKLVYGHAAEFQAIDADFVFLPSIMTSEDIAPGQRASQCCPVIAASSQLVAAQKELVALGRRVLKPPIHFTPENLLRRELRELAAPLGVAPRRMRAAITAALVAQREFTAAMRERGAEALQVVGPELPGVVLVGRSYNTCDLGACQDLPLKLRKMGVLPLPMDYLPLESVDISDRHPNMYWRSGQKILAAARLIAARPHLHAIYVTNFACGPDSFLLTYVRGMMRGKPFLELEMDDHTADAGVITRCEAFLDSLDVRAAV